MPDEQTATGDMHADPWHWLAVYDDGSQCAEYRADGEPRPFAEALADAPAHGPIRKVAMLPQHAGLQPYVVLVPDGARPIVFRRRAIGVILDPSQPAPELPPRITALGWQHTVGRGRSARNYQSMLALYDDGSAVLTSDRNALD